MSIRFGVNGDIFCAAMDVSKADGPVHGIAFKDLGTATKHPEQVDVLAIIAEFDNLEQNMRDILLKRWNTNYASLVKLKLQASMPKHTASASADRRQAPKRRRRNRPALHAELARLIRAANDQRMPLKQTKPNDFISDDYIVHVQAYCMLKHVKELARFAFDHDLHVHDLKNGPVMKHGDPVVSGVRMRRSRIDLYFTVADRLAFNDKPVMGWVERLQDAYPNLSFFVSYYTDYHEEGEDSGPYWDCDGTHSEKDKRAPLKKWHDHASHIDGAMDGIGYFLDHSKVERTMIEYMNARAIYLKRQGVAQPTAEQLMDDDYFKVVDDEMRRIHGDEKSDIREAEWVHAASCAMRLWHPANVIADAWKARKLRA